MLTLRGPSVRARYCFVVPPRGDCCPAPAVRTWLSHFSLSPQSFTGHLCLFTERKNCTSLQVKRVKGKQFVVRGVH